MTNDSKQISLTGFGVDVSARRADDLDKKLLSEVAAQPGCRVLDLGCGAGGTAARLKAVGAVVTGIDSYDFTADWANGGTFIQGDVRNVLQLVESAQFDYCLFQRTIHYLPYSEAAAVLQKLRECVTTKLFISFSGITSELARGYDMVSASIDRRFGELTTEHKQLFGIDAPLTLYAESEAVTLLEQTGWQIDWVRTSDFGTIKVLATAH